MNSAARELAMQLSQRETSAIEYRNRLVRMQNMGCICHCSAEIDMGTLLYFSVNDMYLGEGCFVVLLFSEISSLSAEQQEGRDVFGRMFTYAIIEEVVKEILTGHYSFYASELDGRLAVIVNFPFGLMPDPSIVNYLDNACSDISARCRERYDMDVITYISEPVDYIQNISALYTKLLDRATLHRYTERSFAEPVYHVSMASPKPPKNRVGGLTENIHELVRQFLAGEDYHPLTSEILNDLAEHRASSVDELKRMYGDFFEGFCQRCDQLGIKLRKEHYRAEQFQVVANSIHWAECKEWIHTMLDRVAVDYAQRIQKASRLSFDRAVEYISANLADPDLSVGKCAEAAGCQPSALSKAFRRQLGVSVASYIRDARLDLALALIKQDNTVKYTCEQCGFASTETFHRVFKERYGITPGKLRRGERLPEEKEASDSPSPPAAK